MRTEPFVIDVTVTGFISGFICGPQMLKFYTFLGAGESIGGGGQAPPGVRVILTLRFDISENVLLAPTWDSRVSRKDDRMIKAVQFDFIFTSDRKP